MPNTLIPLNRDRRGRRRILRATSRRGLGVIPVLAVFAVTVTICTIWTKATLRQHRDQQLSELRVQTRWLAEAGVRRGAAQRAANASFAGETWQVRAAEIERPHDAHVVIRIEPTAEPGGHVRIVAVASYPGDKPRVTVTKIVVFIPPSAELPL